MMIQLMTSKKTKSEENKENEKRKTLDSKKSLERIGKEDIQRKKKDEKKRFTMNCCRHK